MFDGKILRELAGMPIRSTDLANSALALAEPEPLTLANLTTKSLTAVIAAGRDSDCNVIVSALPRQIRHSRENGNPAASGGAVALGPRFRGDDVKSHREAR